MCDITSDLKSSEVTLKLMKNNIIKMEKILYIVKDVLYSNKKSAHEIALWKILKLLDPKCNSGKQKE